MSTGYNQDLDNEIKKYRTNKIVCIAVGAIVAVICTIAVIFISITVNKNTMDVMIAYENGEIGLEEYLATMNKISTFSIIQSVLSILITGGAALAIAGGIVNHVKGKNRAKKLKRRSIAEEYGGNGVEF